MKFEELVRYAKDNSGKLRAHQDRHWLKLEELLREYSANSSPVQRALEDIKKFDSIIRQLDLLVDADKSNLTPRDIEDYLNSLKSASFLLIERARALVTVRMNSKPISEASINDAVAVFVGLRKQFDLFDDLHSRIIHGETIWND